MNKTNILCIWLHILFFFLCVYMRLATINYLIEKNLLRRSWKKSEITILTFAHTHCYTKTHIYWQILLARIRQYYQQSWFLISTVLKQPYLIFYVHCSHPTITSICDISPYMIYWHFQMLCYNQCINVWGCISWYIDINLFSLICTLLLIYS